MRGFKVWFLLCIGHLDAQSMLLNALAWCERVELYVTTPHCCCATPVDLFFPIFIPCQCYMPRRIKLFSCGSSHCHWVQPVVTQHQIMYMKNSQLIHIIDSYQWV